MELVDAIKERRSIRRYQNKKVPLEVVGEILAIAKHAPSSGNVQNWRFVVVFDKEKREKLAEAAFGQMWMATAPVHIVICNKIGDVEAIYGERGRNLYSIQNCAIFGAYILLMAKELGLDTCWVGAFDEEEVRIILNIPDDVRPEAIITLGYSAERKITKMKRREIETLTYIDSWGNRP